MKETLVSLLSAAVFSTTLYATDFQVSIGGNDANPGTQASPLRTVQRAADIAQPGDIITVHEGVYRERVNPPRGGESDTKRIVYRAAPGEKVEIKGSEVAKNWEKVEGDVWKAMIPNTFFGSFNPYSDLIHGDWFNPKGRAHHTGAVYLNGEWLTEAAKFEDVMKAAGTNALWFGQVDRENTTIWAQFRGINPNDQLVEFNARRTVFYPDKPGRNYITVRGFTMSHAATPWAPPTAEQVGLIGTHWSKGWIIESNVVSHSTCSGISLGKYGDTFDNTSADTAEGYVKTIERALATGWNRETIGHHIVRDNTISHCEQAGIVGSLGCSFSTVTDNVIHDIHIRRLFTGAEMAGIKFHGAIDVTIRHNHIYRTTRGLWLDWMAQGTHVEGNLFHDNLSEDIFVEVNHGPFFVDNNLFLSGTSLLDVSEGGAYAHNLFAGKIVSSEELHRETPYHPAHSTEVAGLVNIKGGDNRFYNNVFVGAGGKSDLAAKQGDRHRRIAGYGLWVYDTRAYPLYTGCNVHFNGAVPYANETNACVLANLNPGVKVVEEGEHFFVCFSAGQELMMAATLPVSPMLLGKTQISKLSYENAETRLDYFGAKRVVAMPTPGPFQSPAAGELKLKVW